MSPHINPLTLPLTVLVLLWDSLLYTLNLFTPPHAPGTVVPPSAPGHARVWPPYTPPTPRDSRSACPMLNAMANHGILPHDGKNITFKQLNVTVRQTFNFAPSFCFFVPKFAADFLGRGYWGGKFDLDELSLHGAIEHDASLTRHDAALVPDQGAPDLSLVGDLLREATGTSPDGTRVLTIPDLSRALAKRRFEARKSNPTYSENLFHNMFGSANSSTMLTIFGGRVEDLRTMLEEERFADGWEPRVREKWGLTMMKFNGTVLPVERGIKVKSA